MVAVLVAWATPAAAQQRLVYDFTSFSVRPVVTDNGPPVLVDFQCTAWTSFSSYYPSANGDQVMMYASIYNTSTSVYSSATVLRTATGNFMHTFSFTLPADGVYAYWAQAYYNWMGSITYNTTASGTFNTVSRAGIPAAGSVGLGLLGILLAGAGVFLLRRA